MKAKSWSIIVPARNEQMNIERCLQSIAALAYDLTKVEVIVVDNGSDDRTVDVARSFAPRLDIAVRVVKSVAVGELRNRGARETSGNRLCFVDADCVVTPRWLHAADELAKEHPNAVLGAYYSLPPTAGWPAKVWHGRFHEGRSGAIPYIPGGNLLMSRKTFDRVGGFDPALRSNEDGEFCSRARARGIQVLAFPPLSTVHFGAERTLGQFIARQWWHGSNTISRFALAANRKALSIAAYTLLCIVAIPLTAFVGRPNLLGIALMALVCPPLWLVIQDKRISTKPACAAALFVLVLIYALVRAAVLPLALGRFLVREALGSMNYRSGAASGKCT